MTDNFDQPGVAGTKSILLVNDTGASTNPGCKAVRAALGEIFSDEHHSWLLPTALPVGYWAEEFRCLASPSRDWIYSNRGEFRRARNVAPSVDMKEWELVRRDLISRDEAFRQLVMSANSVVVNGEGSLHHNSPRALALMAIMKSAIELGRPVQLINSTLQAMSSDLMLEVLPLLQGIHVRERDSWAYLQQLGIKSVFGGDIAFLSIAATPLAADTARSDVLVTGGVTVSSDTIDQLLVGVKKRRLRPVYFSIGDGGEDGVAQVASAKHGVEIVRAGDFSLPQLISFLQRFRYAVCGRHHINIFLMRAATPFIPLPSNTWKIEGTLRLSGYPMTPVATYAALTRQMGYLEKHETGLSIAAREAFDTGVNATLPIRDTLRQWNS